MPKTSVALVDCQVKWIEGVFEKGAKSSDFPTIILDRVPLNDLSVRAVRVAATGPAQDAFGVAVVPQGGMGLRC